MAAQHTCVVKRYMNGMRLPPRETPSRSSPKETIQEEVNSDINKPGRLPWYKRDVSLTNKWREGVVS